MQANSLRMQVFASYNFTVYAAGYLIAAIVAISTAWIARNSQRRNGASELALLLWTAAIWALMGVFEAAATTVSLKVIWSQFEYIPSTAVPVLYLLFTLRFAGKSHLINLRNLVILFAIPVATIVVAFTNPYHHLLWKDFGAISPATNLMVYHHGPWFFFVHIVYSYILLLLSAVVLLSFVFTSTRTIRLQGFAMIISAFIPWAGSALYLSGANPVPGFDLTRVSIILSGVVITFAMYNYRLFDLVPIARELLIENMEDGILVLDSKNRIQDINPAAKRLLGLKGPDHAGSLLNQLNPENNALYDLILNTGPEKQEVVTFASDGSTYEIKVQNLRKETGSKLIILHNITESIASQEAIQAGLEKYRMIAENTSDVIWTMNEQFRYTYVSPSIYQSRGFTPEEFLELDPSEVYSPGSYIQAQKIIAESFQKLGNGTLNPDESIIFNLEHRCKDGTYRTGEVQARPLLDSNGKLVAVHGVTRDVTERIKQEKIAGFRLRLIDFTYEHTMKELLVMTVDEIATMTGSTVGFFHFIDPDQNSVTLQAWSKSTTDRFCALPPKTEHYPVDRAGVWVDCVKSRKPVIHNDFASLSHRKGMPEGHSPIVRELTVPVIRNNQVVAVLGVGNKSADYDQQDAEMVSSLADMAWDIAVQKKASEALAQREKLLQATAGAVSIILQGNDLIESLSRALDILGKAVGADRVYIFENHRHPQTNVLLMSQRFEWCADEVSPQINNPSLQELPYTDRFARWQETLSHDEVIKGVVADFPDTEKPILEEQGIVSLLVAPVMMGDQWWGFIGFDDCSTEREWTETEVHLLSTAADSIGAAYIRNRQNTELINARDRAEESDRLKSAFLNNMSHEIRSPLNSIAGFASVLKEEDLTPEERDRYVDIINASSDQLLSIINDVLELARLESTQVPLFISPFLLNPMMNEIETTFIPRAERKRVALEKNIDSEMEDPVVECDKEKVKQVLTGLLTNAIRFTDSGQISFGYHLADDSLLFYVKDTGIGIPEQYHEKIFERFYQVELDHRKKSGGTGLGLSIARELVNAMRGNIWVESSPGVGSVFYFTVPLANPPIADITSGGTIDPSALREVTVLIAEDEPFNFEYLRTILLRIVRKIVWAQNGAEVAPLAAIHKPDLYLMDIKMPVMDGHEATRIIRNEDPTVPVIALTAYARPEDREKAMEAGCTAFISKPFKRRELLETMIGCLKKQLL